MIPAFLSARFQKIALGAAVALFSAWPMSASELPEVKRIFQRPLVDGTRPSAGRISPDDRTVAYFWNPDGRARPLNLYVVAAAGGEPRRLTSFTADRPERKKRSWPKPSPGVFLEFSPDARRILFGYDGDLYAAEVETGKLERLTRTDAGEGEASWSPDGKSILYASGGALYRMNYPGPGFSQITIPEPNVSHSQPRWSPDGGKILFVAQEPEEPRDFLVPDYMDEWVKAQTFKRGYAKNRVGIVSPEGGTVTWVEAGTEPIAWLNEVLWSHDGKRILLDYESKDLKTRWLAVTDADLSPPKPPDSPEDDAPLPSPPDKKKDPTVKARILYTETDSKWIYTYDGFVTDTTSTGFSPDDSRILFTSEKAGFAQVYKVSVAGGEPSVVTRAGRTVDWAAWARGGDRIVTLGDEGNPARRSLAMVPAAGGPAAPLQTGPTYNTHPVLSKRGDRVLFEGSSLGVPFDYYVADLASGKTTRVTRTVPDGFSREAWVLPSLVSFPSRDGKTLKGLLYGDPFVGAVADGPPGGPPVDLRPRPAVVFVHGAGIQQNVVEGWTQYSPNFKFATVLVRRGFVVFEVDYRGSTGYGREFRTDVAGHLGGKDLDDELAGVDYLKTLPYVDAERIGIYGGSYGGFMAEMALFRHPGTYAAGAALRPVADWVNYYHSNPGYCLERLGKPEENPEAYRISSPINFSQDLLDPLLLLHGVLDSNVPFQDTVQLTDRLLRQGKTFELMIYPREDHGFTEPENWIDEYSRILDFFERHLKR